MIPIFTGKVAEYVAGRESCIHQYVLHHTLSAPAHPISTALPAAYSTPTTALPAAHSTPTATLPADLKANYVRLLALPSPRATTEALEQRGQLSSQQSALIHAQPDRVSKNRILIRLVAANPDLLESFRNVLSDLNKESVISVEQSHDLDVDSCKPS